MGIGSIQSPFAFPLVERVGEGYPKLGSTTLERSMIPNMHKNPKSPKPSGFTLIELLIVVAIIAILAAIAVPNFLEAQTRSKVSRAVADMRSITVAIEAYNVDQNRYPREYNSGGYGDPLLEPGVPVSSVIHTSLSTPIAYLTNAWLPDPFTGQVVQSHRKFFWYQNLKDFEDNRERGSGPFLSQNFTDLALAFYGHWRLGSLGPNQSFGVAGITNSAQLPYDPTNGTISEGNIWRSQARSENNMPPVGEQTCPQCLLGEH